MKTVEFIQAKSLEDALLNTNETSLKVKQGNHHVRRTPVRWHVLHVESETTKQNHQNEQNQASAGASETNEAE